MSVEAKCPECKSGDIQEIKKNIVKTTSESSTSKGCTSMALWVIGGFLLLMSIIMLTTDEFYGGVIIMVIIGIALVYLGYYVFNAKPRSISDTIISFSCRNCGKGFKT